MIGVFIHFFFKLYDEYLCLNLQEIFSNFTLENKFLLMFFITLRNINILILQMNNNSII